MLERTNQKRRVTTSKQVQSRLSRPFRQSGQFTAHLGHFRFDAKSQAKDDSTSPAPLGAGEEEAVVESVHVDLDTLTRISEKWRRVEEAKRLPCSWTRGQARYAISGAAFCVADVRRRTDSPNSRTWGAHRLTREKDGEAPQLHVCDMALGE